MNDVTPISSPLHLKKSAASYSSADLIIDYLEQLSVSSVFGIPGGAIEPFYNALAKSERRGGPRSIVARHETSSVYMADGYFLSSGKLGVCCATTGPGATNLITGMACAAANNSPILAITAQTALSTFGGSAFQESSCTGINTVGMFEHCSKYNTLVSHPDQLERKLVTAIMTAFQAPYGPVHLSIPLDVMNANASVKAPQYALSKLISLPSLHDEASIDQLCALLRASEHAVFVIGEGAREAMNDILEVAALFEATILTTPHGKGLISPYHPHFRGVIGFAGHQSAREVLLAEQTDLILAIGTSLGEWASSGWDTSLLLNNRLVHVDEHHLHLAQSPMAKLQVRGRIATVFAHVLAATHQSGFSDAPIYVNEPVRSPVQDLGLHHFTLDDEEAWNDASTPIKPQRLMHDLAKLFPPSTRYLADTGASFAWAIHYLHPFDRRINGSRDPYGGLFRACLEFAPMGWAIGSAVGMAVAKPSSPVVCITGDGSVLMNGQEITVAIQEQLTVIFIVLNDAALGMVKHGQRLTGAEDIGHALPSVGFAEMARAMGASAHKIKSPEDLAQLNIEAICSRKGPTLLDVYIDKNEVPPIGIRTSQIKEKS